jgi:hypothetical protein
MNLREEYCKEKGYGYFNKMSENEYVLWLENKLNPPTPEPFVCLEEKFCNLISCRKQCEKCIKYVENKK